MSVVSAAVWLLPIHASADVASPNAIYCDVERQQRDGSRCEACQYERFNDAQRAENCAGPIGQGYTERCANGGMWVRAVYCDREANWLVVGGAPVGQGATASVKAPPPAEPTAAPTSELEPEVDPAASAASSAPAASERSDTPSSDPPASSRRSSGCTATGTPGSPLAGFALAVAAVLFRSRRSSVH